LEEGGTLPKASDTTLERAINRGEYDFQSYRTRLTLRARLYRVLKNSYRMHRGMR
jgi:hypothetical protein